MSELKVYVDWEDNNYGSTYSDVSADLVSVHGYRGRNLENFAVGLGSSARLVFTLRNNSGTYSPYSQISPIANNIEPGKAVQIRIGTTPIWTGFLDKIIPQASTVGTIPRVNFSAVGPIGYIDKQTVAIPSAVSIKTGQIFRDICDSAGWPASQRSNDSGTLELAYWEGGQDKPSQLFSQTEALEVGYVRETRQGNIHFSDRYQRTKISQSLPSRIFLDSDPSSPLPVTPPIYFSGVTQRSPLSRLFNQFTYEVITYTSDTQTDFPLFSILSTQLQPILIRPNSSRIFTALFPQTDLVLGVAQWNSPTIDASGATYTVNELIKGTNSFNIRINNTSSNSLLNIQAISFTGQRLLKGAIAFTTTIEPSSTDRLKYGTNEYPVTPVFYYSDSAIDPYTPESWMDWIGATYKSPAPIVSLTWYCDLLNINHVAELTARELLDLVAVTGGQKSGLNLPDTFTDFFVERIDFRYKATSRRITVTYDMTPSESYDKFLILDVSQIDKGELG